jgi:hypothetical protein
VRCTSSYDTNNHRELHDFVEEDLSRFYRDLMEFYKITVYDVAPKVLPMFDENLSKYAMQHFAREGIQIKTSRRIEELRKGVPESDKGKWDPEDEQSCWTLKIKEDGEVGVGMVVWSTGLMMNPFVSEALGKPQLSSSSDSMDPSAEPQFHVKKDTRNGGVITDSNLRLILEPKESSDGKRLVLEVCRLLTSPCELLLKNFRTYSHSETVLA